MQRLGARVGGSDLCSGAAGPLTPLAAATLLFFSVLDRLDALVQAPEISAALGHADCVGLCDRQSLMIDLSALLAIDSNSALAFAGSFVAISRRT